MAARTYVGEGKFKKYINDKVRQQELSVCAKVGGPEFSQF